MNNTDDKIKSLIIHHSKVIFGSMVGTVGTTAKKTAETLTLCICKSRRVLLLSNGKIHKISM